MKILGFNYKENVFLQYKRNSWNECRVARVGMRVNVVNKRNEGRAEFVSAGGQ